MDSRLSEDVHLHCCGGFVVTQLYGVARTTSDVDFLGVVPNVVSELTDIGGKGSALHRRPARHTYYSCGPRRVLRHAPPQRLS